MGTTSGQGRPFARNVYLSLPVFGGANSIRSTGTKVPGVRPIVVLPKSVIWPFSLSVV
jgi:hypothetical protein